MEIGNETLVTVLNVACRFGDTCKDLLMNLAVWRCQHSGRRAFHNSVQIYSDFTCLSVPSFLRAPLYPCP